MNIGDRMIYAALWLALVPANVVAHVIASVDPRGARVDVLARYGVPVRREP